MAILIGCLEEVFEINNHENIIIKFSSSCRQKWGAKSSKSNFNFEMFISFIACIRNWLMIIKFLSDRSKCSNTWSWLELFFFQVERLDVHLNHSIVSTNRLKWKKWITPTNVSLNEVISLKKNINLLFHLPLHMKCGVGRIQSRIIRTLFPYTTVDDW